MHEQSIAEFYFIFLQLWAPVAKLFSETHVQLLMFVYKQNRSTLSIEGVEVGSSFMQQD